MLFSSRITAVAISVVAATILGACQPKPTDNESMPETQAPPTAADTVIVATESSEAVEVDATSNNEVDMALLTEDYVRAMTRMNDEVMIGISYNDPDTAFAKSMLGLHRGAINMAELQLKYGTDNEMRSVAETIIDEQSQNIDIINKWLASHPDSARAKPNTEAMQQAYADIVATMNYKIRLGTEAATADLVFAREVLPHQLAVVELAKVQLRYGTDVEMRRLAVQLTNERPSLIERLQAWIAANDDSPVNDDFEAERFEENGFEEDRFDEEKPQPEAETTAANESAATS